MGECYPCHESVPVACAPQTSRARTTLASRSTMRLSIFVAFATVSILSVVIGNAQLNESSSLSEVEFSQLSQRDPNALGEKALAIHPEQWKHGETDHFVYHFAHSYVATPVSVEAEFHYRVVTKELERERVAETTDTKSHIYI